MSQPRALAAVASAGLEHTVTRHERATNLKEAARATGVQPRDIVKTLVVRRGEQDYLFVLVPGDRQIAWPKLRRLLGVNRISMPDADEARAATGYERGTITPFGATVAWPVVADAALTDQPDRVISMGAGAHGVGVTLSARAALDALDATVADVTEPSSG